MNRRHFLKSALAAGTAAVGLPAIIPARALGKNSSPSPANRIALGFIGLGGHGVGVNLNSFLNQPDAQVVALCDVDANRLSSAAGLTQRHYAGKGQSTPPETTGDWREIAARDDIDAVVISTPDHWHVLPAVAAARRGKDVFCEKPLTLTIHEGRVLSDTVKQYGRIFQTASENRSKGNFLRACELVRNGRIGKLHTIRAELPGGGSRQNVNAQAHPPQPVPDGFNYDMWLGQAPEAPFTRGRCHFDFRWIFDYSGGLMTDWGAHINDVAQWGNDTEHTGPISVEGHGVFPPDGLYNTALTFDLLYEYANGVQMTLKSGAPGIRFEGDEGWVHVPNWDAALQASSDEILQSVIGPDEIQLRTCKGGEHRDFLDCVKSRQPTYAPAEVGHRTATICHIGNISMLLGRKLRWNPDTETFLNDDQANAMRARAMRAPWSLSTV